MLGEDIGKSETAEGLIYSLTLKGKTIEVKREWKKHRKLFLPIQKHTSRVVRLTTFPYPPSIGDAVITNLPGVEIGVLTADCAPVAIVGEEWVGVIHAGWRGLRSGVIRETIERLFIYEDTDKLFAFVGPCAKGCCYEVGEEFTKMFPGRIEERDGKLFFDLEEAVIEELKTCGVGSVGSFGKCTICSPELPSYRRDKTEERILTSVRIPPPSSR